MGRARRGAAVAPCRGARWRWARRRARWRCCRARRCTGAARRACCWPPATRARAPSPPPAGPEVTIYTYLRDRHINTQHEMVELHTKWDKGRKIMMYLCTSTLREYKREAVLLKHYNNIFTNTRLFHHNDRMTLLKFSECLS